MSNERRYLEGQQARDYLDSFSKSLDSLMPLGTSKLWDEVRVEFIQARYEELNKTGRIEFPTREDLLKVLDLIIKDARTLPDNLNGVSSN